MLSSNHPLTKDIERPYTLPLMADSSSISALNRQAIEAALNCDWQQALEFNLQIKDQEPQNTECLNRLAKAYFELGQLKESQKYYETVLELDPYNSIAQKNLKKIALCKNSSPNGIHIPITISPSSFLAEPGITKSVTLIKVAEPQRLLTLSAGMSVNLIMKARGISITDMENHYLGVLPDDIAFHLMRLIKGGNRYEAFIQSVKQNSLTLLIREVFRSKRFKNQASFLDEGKILSYSSDHLSFLTDDDVPVETIIESDDMAT